MYLVFERARQETLGPIEIVGQFLSYDVGYIPDTHIDIIRYSHLDATVIEEGVANGWVFASAWNGKVSVRGGYVNGRLKVNEWFNSTEQGSEYTSGTKVKYECTPEELAYGLKFFQIVMRKMLDSIYDRRFFDLTPTSLEGATWPLQRAEATAYRLDNTIDTPVLSSLAAARKITVYDMAELVYNASTAYDQEVADMLAKKQLIEGEIKSCQSINDCWVIMHNRFQTSMPFPLQQQLNITGSPRFDI